MHSSFCHMVFTWLEMFSHVFSRYWSLGFAGSVLHFENTLTLCSLGHYSWTICDRQSRASCPPALPWRQLARLPVSSAWWATKEDSWKPKWKSIFGKREGDKERHEEKKQNVVFSSTMCWDNSLKWKETGNTEQWLRKESSHCCCCFAFKIMILWFYLLFSVSF